LIIHHINHPGTYLTAGTPLPSCESSLCGDAGDANPLEVQDELTGVGVPEPERDVLGDLAVLPRDVALGGQAVGLLRVDRLHHGAVRDVAQVMLGGLHEIQDAELGVAHAVVLGERVLVEDLLMFEMHARLLKSGKKKADICAMLNFVCADGDDELTILTGSIMFVMDSVSSSFHSGLIVWYFILDFTFCRIYGNDCPHKKVELIVTMQ
jgi:hypothetical protein